MVFLLTAPAAAQDEVSRRPDAGVQEEPDWEPVTEHDLHTTSPRTWSKHGWQELRFGMALGEVVRLIRRSEGTRLLSRPHPWSTGTVVVAALLETTLYQEQLEARFHFTEGRLTRIGLAPAGADEGRLRAPMVCEAWRADILEGLTKKYGKGACRDSI
ncbi:MAG: hypothetical protein L0Y66_20740, partial [Myxococcaceae bacterium]|nr:hypothetical protein [Myxococcaceae bacterium]